MISFETHGKSRLPRMKNNQSKNLSHHLHNLHVSLLNQRNLIFPWLFKSQAVPSRLTSNINHLIFYRHLGVLSLSAVIFLSKLYILPLLGKVSKLVFKNMHPLLMAGRNQGKIIILQALLFRKSIPSASRLGLEEKAVINPGM